MFSIRVTAFLIIFQHKHDDKRHVVPSLAAEVLNLREVPLPLFFPKRAQKLSLLWEKKRLSSSNKSLLFKTDFYYHIEMEKFLFTAFTAFAKCGMFVFQDLGSSILGHGPPSEQIT